MCVPVLKGCFSFSSRREPSEAFWLECYPPRWRGMFCVSAYLFMLSLSPCREELLIFWVLEKMFFWVRIISSVLPLPRMSSTCCVYECVDMFWLPAGADLELCYSLMGPVLLKKLGFWLKFVCMRDALFIWGRYYGALWLLPTFAVSILLSKKVRSDDWLPIFCII